MTLLNVTYVICVIGEILLVLAIVFIGAATVWLTCYGFWSAAKWCWKRLRYA